MSELSTIGRITEALNTAKAKEFGVVFRPNDVIELLDYIRNLEEDCGLLDHDAQALLSRAEKAEAKVKEWQTVAEMLADELNECNSERRPISWEDASESSPAWIAYTNLRDRDDDE